ncbi:MAG: hypothetical protein A4E69_01870 [Syntrophus sp. PtaB.Bin138]|nr:MAG: hypothetical protein A4E69_01870 [Syntrophus sp. PtaB.Bin138]
MTSNESLVADGVTVTIGETVYTFKTALSDPAVPYEVLIGMNYSEQMHNLFLAITAGPGAGTCYGAGTEAHPDVTSEDVWNAAIIVTAKVPGDAGNLIAKATSSANLAWDGPGSYFTQGRDAETITIDAKTYTWKSALTPLEGEVLIGASAETALANLKNAINHEGVPGTDYSCAAAHPTVTATAVTATTLAVAAKIKGDAGNKIATTETETGAEEHVSWAATTLAGGIDGTPGVKNETCTDGAYLYVCTVANTVTDSNWRRLDLGSAYY